MRGKVGKGERIEAFRAKCQRESSRLKIEDCCCLSVFTCILPTGGETTKKILMVALRKSSCLTSLHLVWLLLILVKLMLGLSLTTSLPPPPPPPTFLDDDDDDSLFWTPLSKLTLRSSAPTDVSTLVREFFLEKLCLGAVCVCGAAAFSALTSEACLWTRRRIEPTNRRHSWWGGCSCVSALSILGPSSPLKSLTMLNTVPRYLSTFVRSRLDLRTLNALVLFDSMIQIQTRKLFVCLLSIVVDCCRLLSVVTDWLCFNCLVGIGGCAGFNIFVTNCD